MALQMPDEVGESSALSPETAVIRALTRATDQHEVVAVGPGDDAAVLQDGTVLCVDAMVEGVHWDERFSASDVGWRLVMVNASDVAAMGATPTWALLAISLPRVERAWVEGFGDGLHAALEVLGVPLLGGDTTRGATPTVSLSMGGRLVGKPLLRSAARPGDRIWVSGRLGDAAGGFHDLTDKAALLRPSPPLHLGPALARRGVRCAMDISDGLVEDLGRLCTASDVGAHLDAAAIPRRTEVPLELALGFGDDYQLLATSELDLSDEMRCIGEIVAEPGIRMDGADWPKPAWTHFDQAGAAR